MDVHEITHIYGTGPFGNLGIGRIFVSPTIRGWLDLAATGKRRSDPEGIVFDLLLMSQNVWSGRRKVGSLPYASRRIMDKLEAVSTAITNPQVRLFTGTFIRMKGGACSQVLWWRPFSTRCVLIGAEEDLGGICGPFRNHVAHAPSPVLNGGWLGFAVAETTLAPKGETDR